MTNIADADQYAPNEQLDHEYHAFHTQVDLPRSVYLYFILNVFFSHLGRKGRKKSYLNSVTKLYIQR